MPSLTECFKRFGVHPIEQTRIRRIAKAYREDGVKAVEAQNKAVLDYIKGLEDEGGQIINQIKERFTVEKRPEVVVPEPPTPQPTATGNTQEVVTPGGIKVETRFKVVDANDLVTSVNTNFSVNPNYPKELQPRQREKSVSQNQITLLAGKLDPERLAESRDAGQGAPIVSPDNVVESGNGRTVAIKTLYEKNHQNADVYKKWLMENAERFGLSKDDIASVKNPVLVRERKNTMTPEQRIAFTQDTNRPSILTMSGGEKARVDASLITPDVLSVFDPGVANGGREFIERFLSKVNPEELGSFVTQAGSRTAEKLSIEGVQRIKNAVFAKAYGEDNANLISIMAEDPDNNIKNITNALLASAPKQAVLLDMIRKGERKAVGINDEMAGAARTLQKLRNAGTRIDEYLLQGDLFGKDPIETELIDIFNEYNRNPKKIVDIFDTYAKMVDDQGSPKQIGLFGESRVPSKIDILEAARKIVEEKYESPEQKRLFDESKQIGSKQISEGLQAETPRGVQASQNLGGTTENPLKLKSEILPTTKPEELTANKKPPPETPPDYDALFKRFKNQTLNQATDYFTVEGHKVYKVEEVELPKGVGGTGLGSTNDAEGNIYLRKDLNRQGFEKALGHELRHHKEKGWEETVKLADMIEPPPAPKAGIREKKVAIPAKEKSIDEIIEEDYQKMKAGTEDRIKQNIMDKAKRGLDAGRITQEKYDELAKKYGTEKTEVKDPWEMKSEEFPAWEDTRVKRVAKEEPSKGYSEEEMWAASLQNRNLETVPPPHNKFPVGQWAKDSAGELMQLREYGINDPILEFPEGKPKNQTVDKYVQWIREGNDPPPMDAVETLSGKVRVNEGHHRLAAIEKAGGDKVKIWVSVTREQEGHPRGVKPENAEILKQTPEGAIEEVAPEVAGGKKPWEMSRAEYFESWLVQGTEPGQKRVTISDIPQKQIPVLEKWHEEEINKALTSGTLTPAKYTRLHEKDYGKIEEFAPELQSIAKGKEGVPKQEEVISDFGKKIGGARKDLWKERGLSLEDVKDMTLQERETYTKKAHVWPIANYEKFVEDGMTPGMAMLVKKIKDSISIQPEIPRTAVSDPKLREEAMKRYIELVSAIREKLPTVRTLEDLRALKDELFLVTRKGEWSHDSFVYTEQANKDLQLLGGSDVSKAFQPRKYDLVNAQDKAEKTGFPAKQEAWQKQYEIRPIVSGMNVRREGKDYELKPGTWYVAKKGKYHIEQADFSSREEAEAWAKDQAKSKGEILTRPYRENIERTGSDYRKGKNKTGDEILSEFGFRGGEFGNWTNQSDRQQALNEAYDALMDLADTLKISPKALSLNGELGIAFGARGGGSAAAHYEPGRVVINLTKTRGAGTLAHEWAHAVDDYFGRMVNKGLPGKYVSHGTSTQGKARKEMLDAWGEVMKSISDRVADKEANVAMEEKGVKQMTSYLNSWLRPVDAYLKENPKVDTDDVRILLSMLHGEKPNQWNGEKIGPQEVTARLRLELIKSGYKMSTDDARKIGNNAWHLEKAQINLAKAEAGELVRTEKTDFLKNALAKGKGKGDNYWQRKHELFARAFESFVEDELNNTGNQSDYLVHSTHESPMSPWGAIYPQGKDRVAINNAFKKWKESLKTKGEGGKMLYSAIPLAIPFLMGRGEEEKKRKYPLRPETPSYLPPGLGR
jgi:hypothetical protein